MKNFRKVLALILVVATLFSFVAMASAKTADEYKDYADVKYTEAVDVLTAIGITEGYDGSYHPNDPIGRDEVAAMVARLRNGGDIDAKLYVGADKVFADVKGQWSEGYVTYCSQLGIIAGRNATTFDPTGKVTGTEVLKMLLCVLGFDAKEQGYTGANWQVNVVRDAKKAGLLIDGVDVYAAATRDEVAQYFLNALNANMVIGYLSDSVVTITNSIYVSVTDDHKVVGSVITPDAASYELAYCNAVISKYPLWHSISGLTLNANTTFDCYGRPGHTWTLKSGNKVVWSNHYTDAAIASSTSYTDATLAAALYSITNPNGEATALYAVEYYADGVATDKENFTNAWGVGNGVEVELYFVNGKIRVVAVHTYIGEVTKVSDYYGYFVVSDVNGNTIGKFAQTDVKVAVNDMVLFHLCNGGTPHASKNTSAVKYGNEALVLHDVAVVEPVIAEVTYGRNTNNWNTSYFTADGETYYYANNYGMYYDTDATRLVWNSVKDNANYAIYVDENGYVMYAEPYTAAAEYTYAYVVENSVYGKDQIVKPTDNESWYGYSWTFMGKVAAFGTDGIITPAEIEISETLFDDVASRTWSDYEASTGKNVGLLVRYQLNADDQVVYEQYDHAAYAPVGAKLSKNSYVIKDATSTAGGVYANENTKFMIRTVDAKGNYTYKQVTGYQNLDRDYVATTIDNVLDTTVGTNIQYFTGANKEVATYVFIDAKYTAAAESNFMLISKVEYFAFDTAIKQYYKDDYVAYTALVDGEKSIVCVTKGLDQELRVGKLYTNMLSFIDVVLVNDNNVSLYVYAEKDNTHMISKDPVMYTYNTENEGFVSVYVDGTYKLRRLASDAALYTIHVEKVSGSYQLTVTDGILELEGEDTNEAPERIAYGYVFYNADGDVSAIYRIAGDVEDFLLAD